MVALQQALKNLPAFESGISAYPNPFSGVLNFEVQSDKSDLNSTIEITDLLGKTVYKNHFSGSKISIDCSAISHGVYIYKIYNSQSVLGMGRLIHE